MIFSRLRISTWWVCLAMSLAVAGPGVHARAQQGAPGGREAAEWTDEHFSIEVVKPQKGWAAETMDPAQWKPVEQPNLAEELKKAPQLALEDVAPPPERCWTGHRPYLVPNPDGKSWDMLYPYYNTYRGEQEVVIYDFGTGKLRKQILSTRKGDSVLTKEPIGFHMKPSYYVEGKLVFNHYGPVLFTVYDPAQDAFVKGVKPFGDEVVNAACVLGLDGRIYGMGWPRDKSGFVAYCFDPKTYKTTRSKVFGPPNPRRRQLYCHVRMSGDWLYAAVGSRPWHLVGYNFKTKEGRLLATTENIIGDYSTIRMGNVQGGLRGSIRNAAAIAGLRDFDRKEFNFWIRDGRVFPRTGDVPPWSDKPAQAERLTRGFRWAREFQVWPRDFVPPSPPPQIKPDSGAPDPRGHVSLPYRLAGDKQWRALEYDVKMYPGVVNLLKEVNDHVLFATDSGYGQHVFYNLKTRRIMRVGGTLSPYSIGLFGGRLYVSGYPTSQMYEYDFTRPLGLKQAKPNPRRVAWVGKKDDTHCPLAGTVGGADGRVYNAGTTYGRRRIGGGFGWYDTKTGEVGGMPIDGHRIFWMTAADQGRYILMASKFGDKGNIFCWDTQKQDFAYRKGVLGGGRPGPIEEALPGGLVMGHHDHGVLYGFRADTGEVLWQKQVPAKPVTGFSAVRRHAYAFRRGPDGHIWSFFGDVLVRIDPRNARVTVVGRVPGAPKQIAFAAGGVYIAGANRLRRIKGLNVSAQ